MTWSKTKKLIVFGATFCVFLLFIVIALLVKWKMDGRSTSNLPATPSSSSTPSDSSTPSSPTNTPPHESFRKRRY